MHCFSLTEKVKSGIVISREGGSHISDAEGSSLMMMLDKELTEFVDHLPPGIPRLHRAAVEFQQGVMVLKKSRGRLPPQALVRLETAGGDGGRVYITANAYDEELVKGRVVRKYRQFPPLGINSFTDQARLDKLFWEGAEILDLFLVMNPGASFRVFRDGRLEGASPQMCVHWNGYDLWATLPRRYDERAGLFAGAMG
jgi:hypothetical protein